ncbi:VanZ family protein [Bacillus sp. UNC322MFChir4.1]|nr:VanZ family protein [Bacillus sp. UNC322MFChir4.1]
MLVLFFMFFAFNRLDSVTSVERYTFILVPEGVPLKFPELNYSWIVDFGNIAAFIPFGILFPLLYRVRFGKFISLFVLVILVLETIQALTYLGSHFLYIPILARVPGFPFVTGLAGKLYKILHTLSVGFFQNAGVTPPHRYQAKKNELPQSILHKIFVLGYFKILS